MPVARILDAISSGPGVYSIFWSLFWLMLYCGPLTRIDLVQKWTSLSRKRICFELKSICFLETEWFTFRPKSGLVPLSPLRISKWRQKFIAPFELSFGGDELWAISDEILALHTRESGIRNRPKFISTKWKFKWWRWTFAIHFEIRSGDKGRGDAMRVDSVVSDDNTANSDRCKTPGSNGETSINITLNSRKEV